MGHDSIRNKKLVIFPDGKMMLFCEVSDSRTFDWKGKRVWDKCLIHPKGTLYYTKDSLKAKQAEYVDHQLEMLREHSRFEVEHGWSKEYVEPTLDSYDYNGTVFPGGSRIRNGKSFYGGRPVRAEEYFREWDSIKSITFGLYEGGDYKRIDTYDILRADLDECYQDILRDYGSVSISVR